MTPEQVFESAIIYSARAIKMDDKIGSIEVEELVVCVFFSE